MEVCSNDPTDGKLDSARELIRLLTGGRIEAYQCGEKKAKQGWLQVRFKVNLTAALTNQVGVDEFAESNAVALVVDIREKLSENTKMTRARQLYDDDHFENEIAVELGSSRARICKLIRQSFEGDGFKKPDGYQC